MKKRINIYVVIVSFLVSMFSIQVTAAEVPKANVDYLGAVIDSINQFYYPEIEYNDEFYMNMIEGIMKNTDIYSEFISVEKYLEALQNIQGSFVGVGIQFLTLNDEHIITSVFKNSPAEQAGVLPSDIIIKVDDVDVRDLTIFQIADLIKGESGTSVKLGLIRYGEEIEFNIIRGMIEIISVSYEIRDDIGYIELTSFHKSTVAEFDEALSYFDNSNITKIVLDLRDNYGGDVTAACQIAANFVTEGEITTLEYKYDKFEDMVFTSNLKESKYELVVIVNNKTASASEILASAIQDRDAGLVIGERTYGKAIFQTYMGIISPEVYDQLKEETGGEKAIDWQLLMEEGKFLGRDELIGYVKITAGEYTTPLERNINGRGLYPDVTILDKDIQNNISRDSVRIMNLINELKLGDVSQEIMWAKSGLKFMGFYEGDIDSNFDNDLYNAVNAFQEFALIEITGELDISTQDSLNEYLKECVSKSDVPYAKAVEFLNEGGWFM